MLLLVGAINATSRVCSFCFLSNIAKGSGRARTSARRGVSDSTSVARARGRGTATLIGTGIARTVGGAGGRGGADGEIDKDGADLAARFVDSKTCTSASSISVVG